MRCSYDCSTVSRSFEVGDKVLAFLPITSSIFAAKFSGLYVVKERLSNTDYVLCTPDRRRKTRVCHINLMKRYQFCKDNVSSAVPLLLVAEQSDVKATVLSVTVWALPTEMIYRCTSQHISLSASQWDACKPVMQFAAFNRCTTMWSGGAGWPVLLSIQWCSNSHICFETWHRDKRCASNKTTCLLCQSDWTSVDETGGRVSPAKWLGFC